MRPFNQAWQVLKNKPIHPAAMNYALYGQKLEEMLGAAEPQNESEQMLAERDPTLSGNMTEGLTPDRAGATLFRNTVEGGHPSAQKKLGGKTLEEYNTMAREAAKRSTHDLMGGDMSVDMPPIYREE